MRHTTKSETNRNKLLLNRQDVIGGNNLSEDGDLHNAAANLFAMLKELDKGGFKQIAVMNIPQEGLGIAINDRLKRAVS